MIIPKMFRGIAGFSMTLVLSGVLSAPAARAAESLRVGAAESDITPPIGYPLAGYYHERLATGMRDPLKAKAIVFRSADTAAALAICDLTGIAVDLSTVVRRRVSAATGIPQEHIVLSATHSHTAPDYSKDLYVYLGRDQDEPLPADDERLLYIHRLIERIVQAVEQANAATRPAGVRVGTANQATPVAFNRRFVMRDGSVRTWMNLKNPDVVRAAGPIDPEIGLLEFRAADDHEPNAVLSNFALHLDTVGGSQFSGDYPFYIEQAVRRELGDEAISMFGTGCCGDINHSDPSRSERNKTDFIGQSLGTTIAEAMPRLAPIEQPTLQVRHAVVPLLLQEVSETETSHAAKLLVAAARGEKLDFFDHVIAHRQVIVDHLRHPSPHATASDLISWGLSRTWAGVGDALPVEVMTITLGTDAAIVCLPGEVFVELGLAIKQASPFATTLVIELSQCVETAYIPTRAACAGGSYEVTNSTLQPGGGEQLVEAAIRLLRESATTTLRANETSPSTSK